MGYVAAQVRYLTDRVRDTVVRITAKKHPEGVLERRRDFIAWSVIETVIVLQITIVTIGSGQTLGGIVK